MKKIKVVAAIIKNKNKEILITLRPEGKTFAGYWEFAGGKIEYGETHQQALIRELREELNIDLSKESFIHFYHIEQDYLEIDFYLCSLIKDISPQPMENQIFKWIKYSELTEYQFIATNKVVINKLLENQQ